MSPGMAAISLTLLIGALLLLFWYISAKREFKKIKERNSKNSNYFSSVEEIRKQVEYRAKDVIGQLEESINLKSMSFPELIRILEAGIERTKTDMAVFKAK